VLPEVDEGVLELPEVDLEVEVEVDPDVLLVEPEVEVELDTSSYLVGVVVEPPEDYPPSDGCCTGVVSLLEDSSTGASFT